MTVFKAFLKVLKKNSAMLIMFTGLMVLFTIVNFQNGNGVTGYEAAEPSVAIFNKDNSQISNDLVAYLDENADICDYEEGSDALYDAMFYNRLDYAIYIDEGFGAKIMAGNNPEVKIESIGSYGGYLSEMLLSRYVKNANALSSSAVDEADLIAKTRAVIKNEAKVEIASKTDVTAESKMLFYFNFMNYSLLAGLTFAIGTVILAFRRKNLNKRTIVSATSYKKINRQLVLCCLGCSVVVWAIYVAIGYALIGSTIFNVNGLLMIGNSFAIMVCSTAIAFLIANLISNTQIFLAIINVISLGSSFLTGVFIPREWMPEFVLNIARALPSYYYVDSNELLANMQDVTVGKLQSYFVNLVIIALFSVGFLILTNFISKHKQKSN